MKNIILWLIMALTVNLLKAQTLTENFIHKIPSIPNKSCSINRASVDNFQQSILELIGQIDNQLEALRESESQSSQVNEEMGKAKAMQQMSQQYGLSAVQMQQMKSGKMSAADKQALANQILQQQTNMSMGEVQNLKNMSEPARKAYAEALGAEMMATQQAGQSQTKTGNNPANMYKLAQDQQNLNSKINATAKIIGDMYNKVEDPELVQSMDSIRAWHNKRMSMAGVDYGQGPEMKRLAEKIKQEKMKICDKYTPRYLAALSNHLDLMKSSLTDQRQLGEVTSQITQMQAGVTIPSSSFEIGELESVKGYLNKLKDAYQYKLYFPEDE